MKYSAASTFYILQQVRSRWPSAHRALARARGSPTPSRRLVLPFPPGGVFDIIGRPWADKVGKSNARHGYRRGTSRAPAVRSPPPQSPMRGPDGYTIFSSAVHRSISPSMISSGCIL